MKAKEQVKKSNKYGWGTWDNWNNQDNWNNRPSKENEKPEGKPE